MSASAERDIGGAARAPRRSWLAAGVLLVWLTSMTAAAQVADNEQTDHEQTDAEQTETAAADEELELVSPPVEPLEEPRAGATRLETQIELRALAERGEYEEAVAVGEELVRLSAAEFGARSREMADALAELADVQRHTGRYAEAELNFLQAIETYRDLEGPYSSVLLEPFVGLGDSYQGAGEYQSAVSAYNEARTVSRRAYGLLSEQQIPILDRMTESLLRMNLIAEAGEHQLTALELVERNHPPGSPETLDAIFKYSAWLRQVGRFRDERAQYNRVMQIIRERSGRDHPAMIRPLREIGNSFRTQRIPDNQGASALQRALDIVESQDEVDALAAAQLLRDIGDWQVAFSRAHPDNHQYLHAWRLLGQVENGEELRRTWFSGPAYVLREPVNQQGLSNAPNAVEGQVLVQFDIDEAGRSDNIVVVSAEPPGFKEDAVVQSVRRSRFRPQMAEGQIVSRRVALQFVYRYLPDDLR